MYTTNASHYKRTAFGFDFGMGLLHFLLFLAWALAITIHEPSQFLHLGAYLGMLGVILLFDAVWWLLSIRYDTCKLIFGWVVVNTVTVLVALLILLLCKSSVGEIRAEEWAFLPVAAASVVDLYEILSSRSIVKPTLARLGFKK